MKFLNLIDNNGSKTSVWTSSLKTPLIISPNSKLALKNINLQEAQVGKVILKKLYQLKVVIQQGKQNGTISIPAGTYSIEKFMRVLTNSFNQILNYNDPQKSNQNNGLEFDVKYNTQTGGIVISAKRSQSKPNATFNLSNVSSAYNNNINTYTATNSGGNSTFAISQNQTNRGQSQTSYNFVNQSNPNYMIGWTNGLDGAAADISKYYVGILADVDNKFYIINNGVQGNLINNITPSQCANIKMYMDKGSMKATLTNQNNVSTTITLKTNLDLGGIYYSLMTFLNNQQTIGIAEYYENSMLSTNEGYQYIPLTQDIGSGGQYSSIKLLFSAYSETAGLLGFDNVDLGDATTNLQEFKSNVGLNTVASGAEVDVEITNLPIDSYDTGIYFGYRRPLIHNFSSLNLDKDNNIVNSVDYLIPVSLHNKEPLQLSQFNVRITIDGLPITVLGQQSITVILYEPDEK